MKIFVGTGKTSYLCHTAWDSLHRAPGGHIYDKDVFRRLSCRDVNFAKVKTMTGRATKRLRGTSCRAVADGLTIGVVFRYTCWRGLIGVAYPDG